MSMNAVAVLRVPYADVIEALGKAEGPGDPPAGGAWVETPQGPTGVAPLDDGSLLFTEVSVASAEPEELGVLLRVLLGPVAAAHGDERGVFVVPARARGDATTYDGVIEDVADLGEWIALPAESAEAGGMDAMLGQVAAMMGNDPEQMGGLWAQAQQLMADPSAQSRLMEAAHAVMGQMQSGKGLDFNVLAQQAREVIAKDPALLARMQEELGQGDGSSSDDD